MFDNLDLGLNIQLTNAYFLLLNLLNLILIDTGNYVGGVFIDLQNVFDTVSHDILCEKLSF